MLLFVSGVVNAANRVGELTGRPVIKRSKRPTKARVQLNNNNNNNNITAL